MIVQAAPVVVEIDEPAVEAKPKFVFDHAKVEHLIMNKESELQKIGRDPNVKWFGLEHKGVNFY